jgi:hypothetical protein
MGGYGGWEITDGIQETVRKRVLRIPRRTENGAVEWELGRESG